ncbi:hypothetical protein A6R68_18587, partial [Neotoma lepida]
MGIPGENGGAADTAVEGAVALQTWMKPRQRFLIYHLVYHSMKISIYCNGQNWKRKPPAELSLMTGQQRGSWFGSERKEWEEKEVKVEERYVLTSFSWPQALAVVLAKDIVVAWDGDHSVVHSVAAFVMAGQMNLLETPGVLVVATKGPEVRKRKQGSGSRQRRGRLGLLEEAEEPISDMTFNAVSLSEIMHMMWQRLGDHGKNWRHVYKSLSLMDYLIKNGSKKYPTTGPQINSENVNVSLELGRYIRDKSKQVITLLMDEQLLFKEREVASWTRQRTSYSMTFPNRLPAAGNSPTACTSVLIPESLTSEKKHSLLTIASLRSKKNTSKVRLRLEQCQDIPSPAGPSLAKDSPPLRVKKWKSTEDLSLLHDECPKQLLPAVPPSITSPTSWLSEGEVEVCNLWDE